MPQTPANNFSSKDSRGLSFHWNEHVNFDTQSSYNEPRMDYSLRPMSFATEEIFTSRLRPPSGFNRSSHDRNGLYPNNEVSEGDLKLLEINKFLSENKCHLDNLSTQKMDKSDLYRAIIAMHQMISPLRMPDNFGSEYWVELLENLGMDHEFSLCAIAKIESGIDRYVPDKARPEAIEVLYSMLQLCKCLKECEVQSEDSNEVDANEYISSVILTSFRMLGDNFNESSEDVFLKMAEPIKDIFNEVCSTLGDLASQNRSLHELNQTRTSNIRSQVSLLLNDTEAFRANVKEELDHLSALLSEYIQVKNEIVPLSVLENEHGIKLKAQERMYDELTRSKDEVKGLIEAFENRLDKLCVGDITLDEVKKMHQNLSVIQKELDVLTKQLESTRDRSKSKEQRADEEYRRVSFEVGKYHNEADLKADEINENTQVLECTIRQEDYNLGRDILKPLQYFFNEKEVVFFPNQEDYTAEDSLNKIKSKLENKLMSSEAAQLSITQEITHLINKLKMLKTSYTDSNKKASAAKVLYKNAIADCEALEAQVKILNEKQGLVDNHKNELQTMNVQLGKKCSTLLEKAQANAYRIDKINISEREVSSVTSNVERLAVKLRRALAESQFKPPPINPQAKKYLNHI